MPLIVGAVPRTDVALAFSAALVLAGCSMTTPRPPAEAEPTAAADVRTTAPAASLSGGDVSPSTASPASATDSPPRVTTTPAPTAGRPSPPAADRFVTVAVGSALPSEDQCASAVLGRSSSEPRPENRVANSRNVYAEGFHLRGSYLAPYGAYESRVTGNFTGTTDEILRWGACKWGFDEDTVRAQAVIESYWKQGTLGDCGVRSQVETNGCASVGLLQVKGADIPATHPGTWPAAWTSSAFNVDYALAVRRLCFEGGEVWLREKNATYAAGDLWGCIGRWYSGSWHDPLAERYIADVRGILSARTWARF